MKRLTYLCGAVIAIALMSGCQTQPIDSGTGKPFGPPLSSVDEHPTTAPSGAPVVEQPTNKVDTDKVADFINQAAQEGAKVATAAQPSYGWLFGLLTVATATAVDQYHRRKKSAPAKP